MKNTFFPKSYLFWILIPIFILASTTSCEEEPPAPTETELTRIADIDIDLPLDSGKVGLTIDTREIVRKQESASSIELQFQNSLLSNLDGSLSIDPLTHLTLFSWPAASLSADQITELKDGTAVRISVKNQNDQIVVDRSESTAIFDGSNRVLELGNDQDLAPPSTGENFDFAPDVRYILVNRETGQVLRFILEPGIYESYHLVDFDPNEVLANNEVQEFVFGDIGNGSSFKIYHQIFQNVPDMQTMTHTISGNAQTFTVAPDATSTATTQNRFSIVKRADGFINIRSGHGQYIVAGTRDNKAYPIGTNSEDHRGHWRPIAASIEWTIEDLGSKFNAPVLPQAKMQFAFTEEIRNCSEATATAKIGQERSQTFSMTVSQEESLQLFSGQSFTQSYGAEVTASGQFYGVGGSATATANISHTVNQNITSTNTQGQSQTSSETIKISTVRSIEVPPRTSVKAYDVIQYYDEISVPFVQRLRLKAKNNNNDVSIAGEAIKDQLSAPFFGGIITEVGSDYVEITIKGKAKFNSWGVVKRNLEDGDPCGK
ncbi:MAG: hypothetical protein AAFR87_01470 [Bacteroidota bacterium]